MRGLSPRVRGNLRVGVNGPDIAGSIPACAGEPSAPAGSHSLQRVYPRVCGGTQRGANLCQRQCGLSPRVRGNRIDVDADNLHRRSIPACAGEPAGVDVAVGVAGVYPRVCGGTTWPTGTYTNEVGLSPRVRGNRHLVRPGADTPGSIPACAGEPPEGCHRSGRGTVYPRVCGGTGRPIQRPCNRGGLSPRVRGNPPPTPATRYSCGSIPACAGEPGPF